MKGLKRKRFKKMLKDKDTWKLAFGGAWLFGLFVNLFASIVFPKANLLFTYGLSFGLVFLALFGLMLSANVWTQKSQYDKEIEKEEQGLINKKNKGRKREKRGTGKRKKSIHHSFKDRHSKHKGRR